MRTRLHPADATLVAVICCFSVGLLAAWAAHGFNVGFDSEIGHFQFCHGPKKIPATPFGLLPNGNPTVCPKGRSTSTILA